MKHSIYITVDDLYYYLPLPPDSQEDYQTQGGSYELALEQYTRSEGFLFNQEPDRMYVRYKLSEDAFNKDDMVIPGVYIIDVEENVFTNIQAFDSVGQIISMAVYPTDYTIRTVSFDALPPVNIMEFVDEPAKLKKVKGYVDGHAAGDHYDPKLYDEAIARNKAVNDGLIAPLVWLIEEVRADKTSTMDQLVAKINEKFIITIRRRYS